MIQQNVKPVNSITIPDSITSNNSITSNPSNNRKTPILCYVLKGDSEPQTFLAPHHLVSDNGVDFSLMPAGSHSLVVDIMEEDLPGLDGVRLTGILLGRNGVMDPWQLAASADFMWVSWRFDLGFSATADRNGEGGGFQNHGNSYTIELPPGAYNVILKIRDRQTGAVGMIQKAVYAGTRSVGSGKA